MGNYIYAVKDLLELFGDEVQPPPPITKRTIELGSAYSPDAVCVPFKYNLGNFIESIEKGANVIVQVGGGCRFGFYAELQREILKSLGYNIEFIQLAGQNYLVELIRDIKSHVKKSKMQIIRAIMISYYKSMVLDSIENTIRLNIGFEVVKGSHERFFKGFLIKLGQARSFLRIKRLKNEYMKKINTLRINKPENPLRIGLIGELYVVMEPFSNFFVEKELAKKGVEVHRFVTLSVMLRQVLFYRMYVKHMLKMAKPYLKYHLYAHGTESVGLANKLMKEGYDGVIHVKPFGCMPEVSAMSALQNLSKSNRFPILFFSFDSQTSEAGVNTRLEAFYDMLVMRRKRNEMIQSEV